MDGKELGRSIRRGAVCSHEHAPRCELNYDVGDGCRKKDDGRPLYNGGKTTKSETTTSLNAYERALRFCNGSAMRDTDAAAAAAAAAAVD